MVKMKTMTEGTPWKHILRFSLPVLAGSLLQQLYNTVDAIVVGKFSGQEALSAVGTTGSFAFFFLAVAIGISAGNGVIVAQFYGAGDERQVRRNAAGGIVFLFLLGLALSVISILLSRFACVHIINVPKSILGQSLTYFRIFAIGLIFQFGYNIFASVLRAIGDSAATLYFLLIASVLNIVLDLLFVAGFHWGVAGAAIATDIAQAVSCAAAYFYMVKRYSIFAFKLSDFRWNGSVVLKTVKIGFPISLQLMLVSVGLTMIQRAINGFGAVMTAAATVGQRIEMYLGIPCMAFQTTLATYTGQNIGAGKMDRIKTGVRQTLVISTLLTLLVAAIVWTQADRLVSLFGINAQAAAYGCAYLKAVAVINLIFSFYVPLFGVFQASNHSLIPTAVATTALAIRVIVTYLLRYSDFLGYRIIWWNGLFGFSVALIISWSIYLSGYWKKNSFIAHS